MNWCEYEKHSNHTVYLQICVCFLLHRWIKMKVEQATSQTVPLMDCKRVEKSIEKLGAKTSDAQKFSNLAGLTQHPWHAAGILYDPTLRGLSRRALAAAELSLLLGSRLFHWQKGTAVFDHGVCAKIGATRIKFSVINIRVVEANQHLCVCARTVVRSRWK